MFPPTKLQLIYKEPQQQQPQPQSMTDRVFKNPVRRFNRARHGALTASLQPPPTSLAPAITPPPAVPSAPAAPAKREEPSAAPTPINTVLGKLMAKRNEQESERKQLRIEKIQQVQQQWLHVSPPPLSPSPPTPTPPPQQQPYFDEDVEMEDVLPTIPPQQQQKEEQYVPTLLDFNEDVEMEDVEEQSVDTEWKTGEGDEMEWEPTPPLKVIYWPVYSW
ncbi:hypothetical protein BDB00DRAFT_330866 [Zychaea mexicana]|uniref:uncharacterized protein n=1 Tax=Zychaea mexicana TaxID=64656 RepID=UPI0022FE1D09|nr:uncharacterized protein BDB00DRAFT_330866 [Zychaea mexicana]KAI9499020.1 hypothetical protein BDB00DRAFT_330866 [Zychaea mexicana]